MKQAAKKVGTRKSSLIKRVVPRIEETFETPLEPKFVASDDDLDALFFEQPAPAPTQEVIDAELARLAELRAILEGVN